MCKSNVLTFELSGRNSTGLDLVVLEQVHHHDVKRFGVATLGNGDLLQFGYVRSQGTTRVSVETRKQKFSPTGWVQLELACMECLHRPESNPDTGGGAKGRKNTKAGR